MIEAPFGGFVCLSITHFRGKIKVMEKKKSMQTGSAWTICTVQTALHDTKWGELFPFL
jgi:hypothetical protein